MLATFPLFYSWHHVKSLEVTNSTRAEHIWLQFADCFGTSTARTSWTHLTWTYHPAETHVVRDIDIRAHPVRVNMTLLVISKHPLVFFLRLVIGIILAVGGVGCCLCELLATIVPLTAVRRFIKIRRLNMGNMHNATNNTLSHVWLHSWALNVSFSLFTTVGYLWNIC